MIVTGRVAAFVFVILSFAIFYIYMYLARRGKEIKVRNIAALKAVPEAIGRSAEMGKPAVFATGIAYSGSLSDPISGAEILASINIMGYIARFAARQGVDFYVITPVIDAMPLIVETLRNAYLIEGKPEDFKPTNIRVQASQSANLSAYLGFLQRERPASCFIIGGILYESVVMAEAGNTIGAMQISGTANVFQIPFLVASTDYTLIMEEVYAAGAMTHADPEVVGSLHGEDVIKFILLGLLFIGTLLGIGRQSLLINLLRM
jgi:hypothetical protein